MCVYELASTRVSKYTYIHMHIHIHVRTHIHIQKEIVLN